MAKRRISGSWLGELAIIVVGVLVALAAENFRQGRLERNVALSFMQNMREDLERDTTDLNRALRVGERLVRCADRLLTYLNDPFWVTTGELDGEEVPLANTLRCVANVPVFAVSDGTYREITATGTIRSLPSALLRRRIIDYYELHVSRQISREQRRVQPGVEALELALLAAGLTVLDPQQIDSTVVNGLSENREVLASVRMLAQTAMVIPPRDYPRLIGWATELMASIDSIP